MILNWRWGREHEGGGRVTGILKERSSRRTLDAMKGKELQAAIDELGITQIELARRLSNRNHRIHQSTVYRWIHEDAVPGPVEAAVRCWVASQRASHPQP